IQFGAGPRACTAYLVSRVVPPGYHEWSPMPCGPGVLRVLKTGSHAVTLALTEWREKFVSEVRAVEFGGVSYRLNEYCEYRASERVSASDKVDDAQEFV